MWLTRIPQDLCRDNWRVHNRRRDLLREHAGELVPDEPAPTPDLPEVHRILGACEFHGLLVREERQPVFFGDRVRPGQEDRVLLRWRLDDGRFRVVFGDLTTDTVHAEDLVDLESR